MRSQAAVLVSSATGMLPGRPLHFFYSPPRKKPSAKRLLAVPHRLFTLPRTTCLCNRLVRYSRTSPSAESLYQAFDGRFDYGEIKRVIETLSDGFIRTRRGTGVEQRLRCLWPVAVK